MFNKMMNRFYYGSSGKGDFRQENLPRTRRQLFWEMLKIRLSGLCCLNLLYAIIWVPSFIVLFSALTQVYSASAELAGMQDMAKQSTMAVEALAETMLQFSGWLNALSLQALFFLFPCIAITGPFTAGMTYVVRNWARDEHASVWTDFWDAFKENWKQGLLVSSITGIIPLILYICWTFYGEMAKQNGFFFVPQILCLMLALLWFCSLLYQYPLMVTYRLRLRDLLRNGFLLSLGCLPMTIALKIFFLLPCILAFAVSLFTPYMLYAFLALAAYYIFFGFSFSRFAGVSYSNAVFDRYINPNIEGALINRGLFQEKSEKNFRQKNPTEIQKN